MENKRLQKLLVSFKNAFNGLAFAFEKEQNIRIEMLAAVFVFLAILITPLQKWEIVVLVMMVFAVLILETLNTLVEKLVNIFKPKINPYARVIKDLMAAAVFLASLAAAIVGLLIFLPYIF